MPVPKKMNVQQALAQIFDLMNEENDDTGSELGEGEDDDDDSGDDSGEDSGGEDENDEDYLPESVQRFAHVDSRRSTTRQRPRSPSPPPLCAPLVKEEELSQSSVQPRSSTCSQSSLPTCTSERGRTAQRGKAKQKRSRRRTPASAPLPEWQRGSWQPKDIPFTASPGLAGLELVKGQILMRRQCAEVQDERVWEGIMSLCGLDSAADLLSE
ncbi:hypothetical protein WMY93_007799 [Mugilogobius chulae]|uniref:Uncharacterized protein n=1 Tax=Mugilogobius chulae TaxID=88201 RepID=A0AAW0PE39_9GOBI